MQVIVTGPIRLISAKTGKELTSERQLRKLNNLVYDEDLCSNYVHDASLEDLDIQGGDIRIQFDAETKQLRVLTTYQAAAKLNKRQLDALKDETIGQWSDGIGEGCFDEFQSQHELRIDLCPRSADVVIEQTADTKTAAKPTRRMIFGAIKRGDLEAVRAAVDNGEDLESKKEHYTPLLTALREGQVEIAKLLLEAGADVHAVDDGGSGGLLTCAMIRAEFLADETAAELAELLCAHGADPNAQDKAGDLPLQFARLRDKPRLAAVLESHGAKLFEVMIQLKDEHGHPVEADLCFGHEKSRGSRPCRSNAQGEVVIPDVTCGTYRLTPMRKNESVEPSRFVVTEDGTAEPATFVFRRID